jgi:hypothetical protein
MSYAQTLEVLARLHVDARFRAAFLDDPSAALASAALTAGERGGLLGVDPRKVERAGRLMNYHRVARVQEQLPWVDVRARPGLRVILEDFMMSTLPELLNREEAIAFCRYLEGAHRGLPAYVAELARCERLRIALAWGLEPLQGDSLVETFQYPVLEVRTALEQPGWPESAPRLTRVRFIKVPLLPAVMLRAEAQGP